MAGERFDEATSIIVEAARAPSAAKEALACLGDLIEASAPFAPALAHTLVVRKCPQHPARAALALACGDLADFRLALDEWGERLSPDRWLLIANVSHARKRADLLNRFFAAHRIAPVALCDPDQPLSVLNIRAAEQVSSHRREEPRISVVMTAYNAERHLPHAVESILQQAYRNLEVLIVDDSSTDGTWSILRGLSRRDSRIIPLRLARNRGTYAAKNVGLSLATGDFVAFHDADDWSHPQRFDLCLEPLMRDPDLIGVSCEYVRLDDSGLFHSARIWPLTRWTPNSVLFRRAPVLEQIGYVNEHRFGSDSEYLARMREQFGVHALRKLRVPLIVAAHRQGSLTTAASTGIDARGVSSARAAYEERWSEALLEKLLSGRPLYVGAETTPEALADLASLWPSSPPDCVS